MKKNIRRHLAAGIVLAAAATGILTTPALADTTGTSTSVVDTTNDTTWGTPPTDPTPAPSPSPTGNTGGTLTPFDTTWG